MRALKFSAGGPSPHEPGAKQKAGANEGRQQAALAAVAITDFWPSPFRFAQQRLNNIYSELARLGSGRSGVSRKAAWWVGLVKITDIHIEINN